MMASSSKIDFFPLTSYGGRKTGFSLIEVLMAVMILGFAMAGIVKALNLSLKGSKDSERITHAVMLAAGQMELIRADSFVFEGETTTEFEVPFDKYEATESITESSSQEGLYELTVTINWVPTGEQIYQLKTMKYDMPFTPLTSTDDDTDPNDPRTRDRGDPRMRDRSDRRRGGYRDPRSRRGSY